MCPMTEARTQNKAILAHLKQGKTITALEALNRFNCFRLAARIYDLKEAGHQVQKRTIELEGDKRISEYSLGGGS